MNISCICCAKEWQCPLHREGEHCDLEQFEPSAEFLVFVNDLTAPLEELPIEED